MSAHRPELRLAIRHTGTAKCRCLPLCYHRGAHARSSTPQPLVRSDAVRPSCVVPHPQRDVVRRHIQLRRQAGRPTVGLAVTATVTTAVAAPIATSIATIAATATVEAVACGTGSPATATRAADNTAIALSIAAATTNASHGPGIRLRAHSHCHHCRHDRHV